MKNLLFAFLLLSGIALAQGPGAPPRVRSLPGGCALGDVVSLINVDALGNQPGLYFVTSIGPPCAWQVVGGGGGTPAWNAVTPATANATFANTTFNTTISNTAATNFLTHSNTTAATNLGVNPGSPLFNQCGDYFTLGATAVDCWTTADVITAGVISTTVTNVSETAGNVVTLTITGGTNFVAGMRVTFTGLTTATWLNSQNVFLTTASATSLTFTDPTSHGAQTSAAETGQVTQANPLSAFNISHTGSGNGTTPLVVSQFGEATFSDGTTYPTHNIGQLSVPGRICSTTGAGNYGTGFPNYGFAVHDICPSLFNAPAPPVNGTGSRSIMGLNSGIAVAFSAGTNVFAINGQIATPTSYTGNIGNAGLGGLFGMYHETDLNHTGNTTLSYGAFFANYNNSVGTCANCIGTHIEAVGNFYGGTNAAVSTSNTGLEVASGVRASATATTDIALHVMPPYTGGTFSNSHQGIVVEDQSAGAVISGASGIKLLPSTGTTPAGYTALDLGANTMTVEATNGNSIFLVQPASMASSLTMHWPLIHGYLATTPCGTGKVFLNADFTSANASGLQAIAGLNCAFLNENAIPANASFTCKLIYSQATNVAGDQFGVGFSNTITNFNAWGSVATNTGAATPFTTGVATGIVSNTPTAVVTFQPGNTGLNIAEIDGTLEAGTAATFQLYVANGTAADVILIKRSSYCQFF
jgi:hypothetical protein